MKAKTFGRWIVLLFMLYWAVVPASAAELPDEYGRLGEALPDEAAEALPPELLSGDVAGIGAAAEEVLSPLGLLRRVAELARTKLGGACAMFASLTALFVLSALAGGVSNGLLADSAEISGAVAYAVRIASALAAIRLLSARIASLGGFFTVLRSVMTALLPVMELIYLSGGNAAAAALTNATLLVWLDLIDLLVSGFLMPAAAAIAAFAAADCFLGEEIPGFAAAGGVIKKLLGFVLGLGAALLASSLGAQSVIATAADGASAKTVKYMAGSVIPVVGSTVGETIRTVAAGVRLLRATVGGAGIAVIAVLLLPVLTELILSRLALAASAAVGEMLGCRSEVRFIREAESLCGYLLAAAVLCSMLFVLALTVFALTASAAA